MTTGAQDQANVSLVSDVDVALPSLPQVSPLKPPGVFFSVSAEQPSTVAHTSVVPVPGDESSSEFLCLPCGDVVDVSPSDSLMVANAVHMDLGTLSWLQRLFLTWAYAVKAPWLCSARLTQTAMSRVSLTIGICDFTGAESIAHATLLNWRNYAGVGRVPDLYVQGRYWPKPMDVHHSPFVRCDHDLVFDYPGWNTNWCSECDQRISGPFYRCEVDEYFCCRHCYGCIDPRRRSRVENH